MSGLNDKYKYKKIHFSNGGNLTSFLVYSASFLL